MSSFKIICLIVSVIFLSACVNSESKEQGNSMAVDDFYAVRDFVLVGLGFQNDYQGRCVAHANEFVKQFCDNDNDGLLNYQEFKYKTNLNNPDTDQDGYLDGEEVLKSYNPLGIGDLLPEKYRYCEKPNQYWCWQAQAYYRADLKYCDQIDAKYGKEIEICRQRAIEQKAMIDREMAVANWDYEACNNITIETEKLLCQKELAYILGAINQSKRYCQNKFGFMPLIEGKSINHTQELQQRCWFATAVATEDWRMCADLNMNSFKDLDRVACVTKIARLNNDSNICYHLKDIATSLAVSRCLGEKFLSSN